ncbi:unnamed protein product [Rhizopus stolonifer]
MAHFEGHRSNESLVENVIQTISTTPSLYSNFAGEKLLKSQDSSLNLDKLEIELIESSQESRKLGKTSVKKALFIFLKAFIGSGVLFLPKAFENGGLALSCVLMVLIAGISLFAILQLVKTQEVVGGSYGEVGGLLYGNYVRYTVLVFLVLSQMGFVCSYFIFISGNLVNIVNVLAKCNVQIDQKFYIWMVSLPVMPMVVIRRISKLSWAAIIADVFILFGLISCLYFTSYELHYNGIGPDVKAINPANFALMIGTATFSFEGIGLVLPIADSMKDPKRFPFVVTIGMTIVCSVYILIGTMSYLAYGSHIQAAVVYNLPAQNALTLSVQCLYSLAIILTAPFMLFPATAILEKAVFSGRVSGATCKRTKWLKNLFRIFLLLICAAIAFLVGGQNLDIFVSLVGSLACVPLCFIFPGLFHLKIAKPTKDKVYDVLLVIFGVFVMIYTLYVTIYSLIHREEEKYKTPPFCTSDA